MFNTRNFIIGLGMGLIISSILLFFSNQSYDSDEKTAISQLNTQQLKQMVEERGFYLYTDSDLDKLKAGLEKDILEELDTDEQLADQIYYVAIPDGMVSSQVTDYLAEIGVLKDKEAFTKQLNEKGLTKNIKAGTYKLEENISLDELIQIITGKKK